MSDQHAAVAITAAAVVATILVARAALLRRSGPGRVTRVARGRTAPRAGEAVPSTDAASWAVREAEQHVHRCWQQLRTRVDPPE
ncbi:hypothetical protein ACH4F6_14900 [Streptomyces sp. NPDC017936]|uniref:hypothetical protein n=1 Tax=Streptomyces sp. NPDC017936 TaxID=3365016 RepID=UPI00378D05DB